MVHLSEGLMKIYLFLSILINIYASDVNAAEKTRSTDTHFKYENNTKLLKHEPINCKDNEEILFNCRIGKKTLSICAYPKGPPYQSFEYRYGELNKIEMKFSVNYVNKNRMHIYIEPINPRATVHKLWFEKNDYGYVISECVGGDCKVKAGLIIFKKGKVVNTKACESNIYGDDDDKFYGHAYFNRKILQFGSDLNDSVSKSSLLILDENNSGYEVDSLYPESGVVY